MRRHGTITHIDNQGTIVQVWMRTDEGRMGVLNFDHRMFWHMVKARGAHQLLGFGATQATENGYAALLFDDEITT